VKTFHFLGQFYSLNNALYVSELCASSLGPKELACEDSGNSWNSVVQILYTNVGDPNPDPVLSESASRVYMDKNLKIQLTKFILFDQKLQFTYP
jgi:hypothetical protein